MIRKNGRRETMEGIELSYQESIRTLKEKGELQELGNIES